VIVIRLTIGRHRGAKLAQTVSVKDFGAVGNGIADDSNAIENAIANTPAYGELQFPDGTYIVDREFYITNPIKIVGPGTVKLKNNSALFNDYTNPLGRYIFHIRADNVTLDGLRFDGNSRNNYKVVGGVNHYYYAVGGTWQVNLVMVGWYGAAPSANVNNPCIINCTFYDSPFNSLDWLMQGQDNTGYAIVGGRVLNNYFELGQQGQCPPSNTRNLLVSGNTFKNAYFCAFQWYVWNMDGRFDGNSVYFNTDEIDMTLVDPALKQANWNSSATVLLYNGYLKIGKEDAGPNIACDVVNNSIFGTEIYFTAGMTESVVGWNNINASEACGIEYANTLEGNRIVGNRITKSNAPGLMLSSATPYYTVVSDNELIGCCSAVVSPNFPDISAGYTYDCQIYVASEQFYLKNNFARRSNAKPSVGALFQNTVTAIEFSNNYLTNAGNTVDVATVTTLHSGGTTPTLKSVSVAGDLQQWSYSMDSFPVGGTLDSFPTGKSGWLIASLGVESAYYVVNSASGATTCAKVSGTTNTADTDTASKLCVFASGNTINARNNLAAVQPMRIQYFYR